jgi:hypothetical protein
VVPFLAKLLANYTFLQTICTGATCSLGQPTPDSAQALQRLGFSVSTYAAYTLAFYVALAFLCFTLGAVIFWRKSDDWMALLVALAVVATVTFNGSNDVYASHSAWRLLTYVLAVLGSGLYVLVLALFPDGRFVPRWTRWLLLCWAISGMGVVFPESFFGWPVYNLLWRSELVLVIALQSLVHLLTGTVSEQPLVIVASTLAIAALFQPLRRRIKSMIDRRFYRRKYDAVKTLAAFSTTIRDEVDLNRLGTRLLSVVEETMQPAHVSLWLCPPRRSSEKTTQALSNIDTVGTP